jgi:hypothetical protein
MTYFVNYMVAESADPRLENTVVLDKKAEHEYDKRKVGDVGIITDDTLVSFYAIWNIVAKDGNKHFDLLRVPYEERLIH